MRNRLLRSLAIALTACAGGDTSPSRANTQKPSPPRGEDDSPIQRVVDAPVGTEVYLFAPDGEGLTLVDQAATLLEVADVDSQGRFEFTRSATDSELVVSAAGLALLRVPVAEASELRMSPEARVDVQVRVDGEPVEDALAIVRDATGFFLPLPVSELVSDRNGRLTIPRLPGGTYEVMVSAADGVHFVQQTISIGAGQRLELTLDLVANPDLQLDFLAAVGGDEAEALVKAVR